MTASDGAASDNFGFSVAVSGDTAIVGGTGKSSGTGAAYVFVPSGTTWTQQAKLTSPASAGFAFGISLAVEGDTAVSNAKVRPGVTVGGANAVVQFRGMTPGFVGLGQINFVVLTIRRENRTLILVDVNPRILLKGCQEQVIE